MCMYSERWLSTLNRLQQSDGSTFRKSLLRATCSFLFAQRREGREKREFSRAMEKLRLLRRSNMCSAVVGASSNERGCTAYERCTTCCFAKALSAPAMLKSSRARCTHWPRLSRDPSHATELEDGLRLSLEKKGLALPFVAHLMHGGKPQGGSDVAPCPRWRLLRRLGNGLAPQLSERARYQSINRARSVYFAFVLLASLSPSLPPPLSFSVSSYLSISLSLPSSLSSLLLLLTRHEMHLILGLCYCTKRINFPNCVTTLYASLRVLPSSISSSDAKQWPLRLTGTAANEQHSTLALRSFAVRRCLVAVPNIDIASNPFSISFHWEKRNQSYPPRKCSMRSDVL